MGLDDAFWADPSHASRKRRAQNADDVRRKRRITLAEALDFQIQPAHVQEATISTPMHLHLYGRYRMYRDDCDRPAQVTKMDKTAPKRITPEQKSFRFRTLKTYVYYVNDEGKRRPQEVRLVNVEDFLREASGSPEAAAREKTRVLAAWKERVHYFVTRDYDPSRERFACYADHRKFDTAPKYWTSYFDLLSLRVEIKDDIQYCRAVTRDILTKMQHMSATASDEYKELLAVPGLPIDELTYVFDKYPLYNIYGVPSADRCVMKWFNNQLNPPGLIQAPTEIFEFPPLNAESKIKTLTDFVEYIGTGMRQVVSSREFKNGNPGKIILSQHQSDSWDLINRPGSKVARSFNVLVGFLGSRIENMEHRLQSQMQSMEQKLDSLLQDRASRTGNTDRTRPDFEVETKAGFTGVHYQGRFLVPALTTHLPMDRFSSVEQFRTQFRRDGNAFMRRSSVDKRTWKLLNRALKTTRSVRILYVM